MGWEFILMIIVLVLFYIGYFIFFYYAIMKNSRKRKCLYSFYKILQTVYAKNLTLPDALAQIQMDYNQLALDPRCICNLKLIELLNYVIYCVDSNSSYRLGIRSESDLKNKIQIRDFALQISQQINNQDPFAILSEKDASILNTIKNAIDTNNPLIGNTTLIQLATELQSKEKQLKKEKHKSNLATLLSIVGLVLTVLFGILSFIP